MLRPALISMALSCSAIIACGNGSNGSGDGGWDASTPCEAGQTRCDYANYQECVDGFFTTSQSCAEPWVCAQDWGCVACNPARPTTCVEQDVFTCRSDATIGELFQRCGIVGCEFGSCREGCTAAAQLIYVVDFNYRLLSFNPAGGANEFRLISQLNCPAAPSWPEWYDRTATPFSMSVDRAARAWVLYTSGEIFWVDTTSGACQPSPYEKGQQNFELFGMGFVSDEPDSELEKLYIAGGRVGALNSGNVGRIDPASLQATPLGPMPAADHSPELTGTGAARLYAYFPGDTNTYVAELDKNDGQVLQPWPLPGLAGDVRAWAFAHWGGKFYIFVTIRDGGDENSQVIRLDPNTGNTETLLTNTDYKVVGAGVSTCAPTQEP